MRIPATALLTFIALIAPLRAQEESFQYWPGTRYDTTIPTFDDVLGHDAGERMVSHAEIQEYLGALARAAPDRIRVFEYARSWEDRELVYAVVASPENLAQIDAVRLGMQQLADPRVTDAAEADKLISDLPAVAWLAYGVHGNEISSVDAALQTAYHLLAAQGDPTVDEILAGAIVVIDPSQNPDGRDRWVNHYRVAAGLEADDSRWSAEHSEPWPGGRTNHYHFDLNRDYFALTQPETRGRVSILQQWYPLVYVDLHEMGGDSTYYFAPSARPTNPHLTTTQKDNEELFGRVNASWFDHFGFDYFTREVYDAFYPGYGDSWPNFLGAVGMTYEQASTRGMVLRRSDGATMHFRDTVRQHFVASIGTAQAAARHRAQLLEDFYEYHRSAIEEGRSEEIRAYVLPRRGDVTMVDETARLLSMQGVEIGQSEGDLKACDDTFPPGSYSISLAQPRKRLVRTLLDQQVSMEGDFLAEQERRRQKRMPHQIYDITAFSLPYLFNIEAIPCASVPDGSLEWISGDERTPPADVAGAAVAYLVPWGSIGAARLLTGALRDGLSPLSTDLGFTQNEIDYPRGTLIFKVSDHSESLASTLSRLADASGATLVPTDTSWVESGTNFGSGNVERFRKVRIAMAWDSPTSGNVAGNTRYVMERRFGYPITAVRTRQLAAADLSRFDVLLLPGGSGYQSMLGDRGLSKLKDWVETGGTLIGFGGALSLLADPEVDLLASRREKRFGDSESEEEDDSEAEEKDDDSSRVDGVVIESESEYLAAIEPRGVSPDSVPGVLARAVVDQDHWITAGLPENVYAMLRGNAIYTPLRLEKGVNALRWAGPDDLVASGYLWEENRRQLAYKPFVMVQPRGRGFVIGFTADPNFRGYSHGLNILFVNAVFRGSAHARPAL